MTLHASHLCAGLELLVADLLALCAACAGLAERHRHTLMAGRTLLQQALPVTFGLKASRWLALALRQRDALRERRERSLALQLGGAVGTLASLGDHGLKVVAFVAEELNLPAPDLPWYTERDRVAEVAAALGVVAGAMAKFAGDVALLAQTEVGEVSEGAAPDKGGSSTMPQKHNPVDATTAIAALRLALGMAPTILSAMAQEHERAVGGWQAEWAAIPDLFRYTVAVFHTRSALADLHIDPARMDANLNLTNGLIMAELLSIALTPHMGRAAAQRLVKNLCDHAIQSGLTLRQVALTNEQARTILTPEAIDHALDPANYLGSTGSFIDRALAMYHRGF